MTDRKSDDPRACAFAATPPLPYLQKAGATSDNVTVIALEWESPDEFETTRGDVTSSELSDSGFSSTEQAARVDPGDDDLDDAAIERSIAEINEAIRRTASKRR